MKKYVAIVLVTLFSTTLVGCSTIKGIGEDVSAVGGWIKKGSDNVKENVAK